MASELAARKATRRSLIMKWALNGSLANRWAVKWHWALRNGKVSRKNAAGTQTSTVCWAHIETFGRPVENCKKKLNFLRFFFGFFHQKIVIFFFNDFSNFALWFFRKIFLIKKKISFGKFCDFFLKFFLFVFFFWIFFKPENRNFIGFIFNFC